MSLSFLCLSNNRGVAWQPALSLPKGPAFRSSARLLLSVLVLGLGLFAANGLQAQGTLVSGEMAHSEITITNETHTWTFTANAGDSLVVRAGEMTPGSSLAPWVRLLGPNGLLLSQDFSGAAAEASFRATNSGTFTVLFGDGSASRRGTGPYRLTLARSGSGVTPVVSSGDEGGGLTNGLMHTGTIEVGDLDVWQFSANAGENFAVRVGETIAGSSLSPWIRVFSPNGVLLDSDYTGVGAEAGFRATNSGIFTVVIGDGTAGVGGTGPYRLTLAKTGSPVEVSAGDEGGALVNGLMHTGTIEVGDLDVWTFTAAVGETMVVRAGESTAGSSLSPWLRLMGPTGVLLDSDFTAVGAEVSFRATNSGTYLVLVGDSNNGLVGSGPYRLTLAKTGSPIEVSTGDEGGPLANGLMQGGFIDVGDLDVWSFSASAGESFVLRMGETEAGSSLRPWLRVYGPNGLPLGSDATAVGAEASFRATNSGVFLVVVGDGNAGLVGSGPYRLTLAKTGSAVDVSAGDEGGPLTNGILHTGTIEVGDLDVWTFNANVGESLVVRVGEASPASSLSPWIRLYNPSGVLVDADFTAVGAEAAYRATNSGTFVVVVGDGNAGYVGSGPYRLTLAKTGSPVEVSAGDEGGFLTNGLMHTGMIDVGDLDVWTFTANAGESLVVRMGEVTASSSLSPWVRLYGPSGPLLSQDFTAVGAEAWFVATNTGVYTVVVGDGNSGLVGSGTYRLTLARPGSAVEVSAGDEGGTLTNGLMHTGMIDVGDLDVWSFTANAGETLIVRMGEAAGGSSLSPWVRLFSPAGPLLGQQFGGSAGEALFRATNSGTFLVAVGDGNAGYVGSGPYRLTLVRTGSAIAVSTNDESGLLSAGVRDGTIETGDLDVYSFTACAGDPIGITVSELEAGSSLSPWLRLYGRDGVLLNTAFQAGTAQITRLAPATGTYTIVIGDGTASLAGVGGYRLSAPDLSAGMKMCHPIKSGTNLVHGGVGGPPGATFVVITSTNIITPYPLWERILTNQFGSFGEFTFTNRISPGVPERFFRFYLP